VFYYIKHFHIVPPYKIDLKKYQLIIL